MLDDLLDHATEALTTPFEDWCEVSGIHPEAVGAWECFSAQATSVA